MTEQDAIFAAFAVAPAGLAVFLLAAWHLILAPAELIFEATGNASAKPAPPRRAAAVNWEIWKKKDRYRISELAAIIAKDDPIDLRVSHDQEALTSLLLDNARDKKIPIIKQTMAGVYGGREYDRPTDEKTLVTREAAIKWARDNGFDVEHVE